MLQRALSASPVHHIAPDCPPAALFCGLGMVRIDIPNEQSMRTFRAYSQYGGDCFMFANTNGEYGRKYPVVEGMLAFFDQYLRMPLPHKKAVAVPGRHTVVENSCDRTYEYSPLIRQDGKLLAAAAYLEQFFGVQAAAETVMIAGRTYVPEEQLEQIGIGCRYYADKDMAVLVPASVWAVNKPQARN